MHGKPLSPVLVGRDDLAALAARRLAAVRDGAGHLLFLAGEAGIGKSRLLAEACAAAAAQGVRVVSVAAYPRDAEVAGGLLGDLAVALVDEAFAARLRESGGAGDASRQRRLLVTDLTGFVLAAAGGGPIVVALEDLHWADELTLEVLDRVAGRLAGVPMLVIGTYRSDELFTRVPMRAVRARLLTQRLAEEARLTRLDAAGTAAMVRAITGDAVPADVIATVHERSDGIPLHVEEFLAILTGPDAGRAVPDTLADAVLSRAQDLSAVARSLAEAASVIGRSFDLDLLTAITDRSPDEVDAGLAELQDQFFIRPGGAGASYDFRHALLRDALYTDLAPLRRRDLHGRVAALGTEPAVISDHYERAHQPAPAYRYALEAATTAASLSAHREAVQLYRRAQRTTPNDVLPAARATLLAGLAAELAAIDDNSAAAAAYASAHALRVELRDIEGAASLVPAWVAVRHLLGAGQEERTAALRDALPESGAARTGLLAGLAAAYMLDRRLEEAISYGQEARVLAADPAGDSAADSQDWGVRLNIDATLGSVLIFAGRASEGWPLLEWAIGAAREAELEAEAARGYRMLGSSASVLVEYDRAEHWLREGIAYAERTERFNDRHYMAAHLGHVLWAVGDWEAAEREARRALADGRGGVTTRIQALHVLGYLALGRGSVQADEFLTEARELGERMGELQRLSPALWGLAEHAVHSGRPADAAAWCERGYTASAAVDDAAYLFPFLVTGTRAYLTLDDRGAARDWVGRVSVLLQRRGIPGTLPALDHAQGLLHLSDGQTGRARDALSAASEQWDRLRRFWEGTAALLDRASAAERSRRPGEAGTLRAEAHARATAAGAVVLLSGVPSAATVGPLSARELEVARLVATGATNRQIAESLTISPKTVAAHVEHILAKLDADRRAEIAAWVATHVADR